MLRNEPNHSLGGWLLHGENKGMFSSEATWFPRNGSARSICTFPVWLPRAVGGMCTWSIVVPRPWGLLVSPQGPSGATAGLPRLCPTSQLMQDFLKVELVRKQPTSFLTARQVGSRAVLQVTLL